jgi:hypothetical protein
MWRMMHEALQANPSWHGRKMSYYQMARFLGGKEGLSGGAASICADGVGWMEGRIR